MTVRVTRLDPEAAGVMQAGDGNRILCTGRSQLVDSVISFKGKGNLCCIRDAVLQGCRISFEADGALVFLSPGSGKYRLQVFLHNGNVFYMGSGCTMNDVLAAHLSEGRHAVIGDDCMFSRWIRIRTADPHLVYSTRTKRRVNPSKSVFLGDHVWVGESVRLLKGTRIASGSVIGMNSVVAGKEIPSNTSWAGNPARLIARDVFWTRHSVHDWKREDTERHETMETERFTFAADPAERIPFGTIEAALSEGSTSEEKLAFLESLGRRKAKNRFAW